MINGKARAANGTEYSVLMDPGPTVLVNNSSVYDDGKGNFFLNFFHFKYQFPPDDRPQKGEMVEISMPPEAAQPVGRYAMSEETLRGVAETILEHLRKKDSKEPHER